MRNPIIIALAGVLTSLICLAPAMAGTVGVEQGKITWSSKECEAPTPPPSVLEADRHSAANDMNVKMTAYNAYVSASKIYMDCLSAEAEKDAAVTSVSITDAAKDKIEAFHKSVTALGASLQKSAE